MGIRLFSASRTSSGGSALLPGDPNPERFEIQGLVQIGRFVVATIVWPDAKNFEGRKIAVYRATPAELRAAKRLDPHFQEDGGPLAPIARFEPTLLGKDAALACARYLAKEYPVTPVIYHGLLPRIEFDRLWNDTNCRGNPLIVFYELVGRYDGERRHYHTLTHVMWVIRRLGELTQPEKVDGALLWAAWFHDAVLTGAPSDEHESAKLAGIMLSQAEVEPTIVQATMRLIEATAHDRGVLAQDEALLSDADLAILGASREAFDEYEALVRKEWAHVPDADFAKGRTAILQRFLERPSIYFTARGRELWEARARENLAYSIKKLGALP